MRLLDFLYPALLAVSSLAGDAQAARKPATNVLLSTVKTLTLRKDLKTTHRRVSAVPQLKCIGGNAKGLHEVDVMRCTNQGSDYDDENVQWTCTASLPPEFKLGSTDVICEGYLSADDPYILKGSCGVEYRLALTEQGEAKYGRGGMGHLFRGFKPRGQIDWSALVFWALFLGVLGWIVYSALLRNGRNLIRRGAGGNYPWGWGGGGGGGGGGGWGGHDDPPPPYDYHAPRKPRMSTTTASSAGQQGWRPGFWTGVLGGTAAGYLAGNRGQPQPQRPQGFGGWGNQRNGGFWGNDAGEGSSAWGGRARDSSNSGSSAASSSRHDSTGFGSTSRR